MNEVMLNVNILSTWMISWIVSESNIALIISMNVLQIRYLLVVILELNSVSEVQYKGMMTDRWWKVSIGIIDVVKSEI